MNAIKISFLAAPFILISITLIIRTFFLLPKDSKPNPWKTESFEELKKRLQEEIKLKEKLEKQKKFEEDYIRRRLSKDERGTSKEEEENSSHKQQEHKNSAENDKKQQGDPHRTSLGDEKNAPYYGKVLGLKGKVTMNDVKKRYRELVSLYHPDKVNHLGEKLRQVAEEEIKEINEAYEYFKKRYE
jgi:DnaJ domain